MRLTLLLAIALLFAFMLFPAGCGSTPNCPTCGTTKNGTYGVIDIIPVPEHNPTGEPGGPFNSFDISVADSVNHRFFVSDRIGLDVVVVDTINKVATNIITGDNGVAGAGDNPALCTPDANGTIPPLRTAMGNFTRFGCRTMMFSIPGFGANGHFGGFPGAQCCAARANGVNPLSAPDGEVITADGNTLFIANGSSSVVAFDLTQMNKDIAAGKTGLAITAPTVLAVIPTGQSPDYDGCVAGQTNCGTPGNTGGIQPCIASANGRAFSDPTCGDLRADEMSYDEKDKILLVANGDPGFPFVTLIDVSGVVAHTSHCLPASPTAPYGPTNFPTCILGQIYYDGSPQNNINVKVDDVGGNAGITCPNPSTTAPSGVSGHASAATGGKEVPCHRGPFIPSFGFTAVALAGIGGSAFNTNTGHFLVTNANASATDLTLGTIDEIAIDPVNGPVVVNFFPMPNCMPSSIVQGPGNNFLVGCADHDGEAFPPNEYVINGSTGKILANIPYVGGVDETWYNPGDNRYYLAARDMPTGPVMGVIDAATNQWLQNVATNANSHSIAVDSTLNHAFVPMQSGGPCGTQSSNGCIGVFAQQ